jgi:toxin YoeB
VFELGRNLHKAEELLAILQKDPLKNPPPFEKLVGDLSGVYSRRLNIQHRLVYQVYEKERIVKIIRMWTHYE